MAAEFNPPPGWPEPPSGWLPDAAWVPEPDWPPPPADWTFWVSTPTPAGDLAQVSAPEDYPTVDPRSYGTTEALLLGVDGPADAAVASIRLRRLAWIGFALVVLLAGVASGVSGALLVLGLSGLAVAVVALVRGHVDWARVRSRRAGSVVGGAAVVALIAGAASATPAAPSSPSYLVTAPTTTRSSQTAAPSLSTPVEASTSTRSRPAGTTTSPASSTRVPSRPPAALAAKPQATPRPTRTPTATTATQTGVHPGAFCSPKGAIGLTVKGLRMVCTSTPTDARNRWRRA